MASSSTSNQTIYLITGASRGIGHAITSLLLLRPSTTVIASIRPTTDSTPLTSITKHPTSHLFILHLDSTSPVSTHQTAISTLLTTYSISHIDTVLACAGMVTSMASVSETTPEQILSHVDVNACGILRLWSGVQPYLMPKTNVSNNTATTTATATADNETGRSIEGNHGHKGKKKSLPKFVVLSSSVGSIGAMEPLPGLAYGIAKCAANFLVKKVAMEYGGIPEIGIEGGMLGTEGDGVREKVIAVAVHPGFVKTRMGNFAAEAWGGKIVPPMEVEESARAVVELVDSMTWESASGKFLSYDRSEIPW